MKWKYLIIDCEMGSVKGTNEREVAEWYSNGDFTLVVDLGNQTVLFGNETLTLFQEDTIEEAVKYNEYDEDKE